MPIRHTHVMNIRITSIGIVLFSFGALAGLSLAQDYPPLEAVPTDAPESLSIALTDGNPDSEQWERLFGQTMVRNVEQAAIYPVIPDATVHNGKSVIVVPGGGYRFVSMDNEGFRVAEALEAAGYTAFVLKYRPMPTSRDPEQYMAETAKLFDSLGKSRLRDYPPAVDDLAAAIRYVHEHANRWNLDPASIGVIGFSAGARTAIRLIEERKEATIVQNLGLMYPPMVQTIVGGPRPPLFMAIAVDDPLFTQGGLIMLEHWLDESDKTEFHLYSGGSHGFGMRSIGTTSDGWIEQYIEWLGHQ